MMGMDEADRIAGCSHRNTDNYASTAPDLFSLSLVDPVGGKVRSYKTKLALRLKEPLSSLQPVTSTAMQQGSGVDGPGR